MYKILTLLYIDSPSPIRISTILTTPQTSHVHYDSSSPWSSLNVESQNSTFDVNKTKAFILVLSKDSPVHSQSTIRIIKQESNPFIPSNTPSSLGNEFCDIPLALLNLSRGNKGNSEATIAQVLEHLVVIPTTEQMTNLITHITQDIDEKLEQKSIDLQNRMDKITTVVDHLPRDMGKKLNKQLKSLFKDVSHRLHEHDLTLLKTIDEHKKVVQALQC